MTMGLRRALRLLTLLALGLMLIAGCAYAAGGSASRWIVVYKNATAKAFSVRSLSTKTRHNFGIIPGYAADLTSSQVNSLKKDPSVAYVQPDAVRHTMQTATYVSTAPYVGMDSGSTQIIPYGIDLVRARGAWPYSKGSGVRVAHIDTGVDLTHPDAPYIVASTSFTSQPVDDSDGHGTHTSGTIAAPGNAGGVVGVAPQAGLLVAQVFDGSGNAYDSDIIAAIEWAMRNGANVISMSLGGSDYDSALEQACASAVAQGAVVVAAAGNDGTSAPSYPAAYSSVISVAAVEQSKQRASFSNYGPTVALCAPGVGVTSTVPVGTGWLASAVWNGSDHETGTMDGSANGNVTAPVVYCGLGNPSDFPSSVRGKIAHIRRGTLTFQSKVQNAFAAGAAGVIISNNTSGTADGTLSGSSPLVVVTVSQTNGDELLANDGITATIGNTKPADYEGMDGTSMATPHVAGVAALLYGARHGHITPAEVTTAMESTAEDLGATGRDDYYGYGLVNATAALGKVIPVVQSVTATPSSAAPGATVMVTVQLSTATGLTSVTANGAALAVNGTVCTGTFSAASTPGAHAVDVAVSDTWGNVTHDTTASYTTGGNSAPGIAISSPSVDSTASGPVSYIVTYSNATAVTLSTADVTLNRTGTATGTVSVSGIGTSARTVTISNVTGSGTLGISVAAGTASNTYGSAASAGPSATFGVTDAAPGISVSGPSASSTTAGPVSYTVTYSNATSVTLSAANVSLNRTGTATGTVSVTGTGTSIRTITISSITGSGSLGISVAAATASNAAGSAAACGPSATFTVSNPLPSVTIGAPSASSTAAGPVTFTITYSNARSITLTAANLTLNKTGTATGSVAVTGSGTTTRTITVSNITGNGSLGVSIAAGTASNTSGSAPSAGPSATFAVKNPVLSVAFTFPTTDLTCTRNVADLAIAGTASGDSSVTSVKWSFNSTPGGTCSGTTSWSASGITLLPGPNSVSVTATDTKGNTATATMSITYTDAQPGNAWQGAAMVSLPIVPDDSDPLPVVGFDQDRWYSYNTAASTYLQYADPGTWFLPTDSTPGRGFWAYFATTGGANVSGNIPSQSQPKTIHLHAGWNLIGQPFITSVPWNVTAITVRRTGSTTATALGSSTDVVTDYAWGWDPVKGSYYLVMDHNYAPNEVNELQPWRAYWLQAFADCDLTLPAP